MYRTCPLNPPCWVWKGALSQFRGMTFEVSFRPSYSRMDQVIKWMQEHQGRTGACFSQPPKLFVSSHFQTECLSTSKSITPHTHTSFVCLKRLFKWSLGHMSAPAMDRPPQACRFQCQSPVSILESPNPTIYGPKPTLSSSTHLDHACCIIASCWMWCLND